MEKFRIGMNIRDVITVANMNEIADAVNWTKEHGNGSPDQGSSGRRFFRAGEIRIKNVGSAALDQFSAVALTGLELTSDNCDTFAGEIPTFTADVVTAARQYMPWAICLEPANVNEMSKALILGVTPALVTINDPADQYAQPLIDSATGELESCQAGSARILCKEGDTGLQWCILQLGGVGNGGASIAAVNIMPTYGGGDGTILPVVIGSGGALVPTSGGSISVKFPYLDGYN